MRRYDLPRSRSIKYPGQIKTIFTSSQFTEYVQHQVLHQMQQQEPTRWKPPDAVMVMIMMMNCFCGMVQRRKVFSLVSSRDYCQRSSPSRISDTLRAEFEPAQNLSSGFVEWSCAVATVYHDGSAYSTKRFQPVEQQEELVGAMLLRLSRTNGFSYILCQGLDSILRFVVNLAFLS